MQFRLLALALGFASALPAQPERKPQMIWQGEVEGSAFLYIHGKRLQVEAKSGSPVAKQRYHFYEALPDTRQDVRLDVSEGRGFVHIAEQPRADNRYTLAVAIEDRQTGSSFYSIALYWNAGDVYDRRPGGGTDRITWSGRVDDEVLVSCRGSHCTSETVSGAPVMHERVKVSRPLPDRDVLMTLENVDGRGEVRLVEQPAESNGYTARVRIRDPQGGAGDYSFALTWARPGRLDPQLATAQTGLVWSGRVEGTIRVTVRGGAAFSQVVNGHPVEAENARFERPLPSRSDLNPSVKKRQGRGNVDIVEVPSNRNGYQLVFEVRDSGGGSDLYEVEVAW
jgi:hypothetical protein